MTKRFKHIYFELTNICDRRCSFCTQTERKKMFMPIDDAYDFIRQAAPLTESIYWHLQGEPLLHPDFEKITSFAKNLGLNLKLTTNASQLENFFEYLASGVFSQINFSIQSLNETGLEEKQRVLKNIGDFISYAMKKNPDLYINLRFWQNLPPDMDFFVKRFDIPREKWLPSSGRHNVRITGRLYCTFDHEFVWPSDSAPRDGGENGSCKGLIDHCGILCDGAVVPCCLDASAELKLGDLHQQSLAEILNTSMAMNMETNFRKNKRIMPLCRNCSFAQRFDIKQRNRKMPKAYIHTFGCRLNNADSALINFRLLQNGYTLSNSPDDDIALVIVNSCCVTAEAGRKSAQFVRKIRKDCPNAKIIFTGCAAEKLPHGTEIPADIIIKDKRSIPQLFETPKLEDDSSSADVFEEKAFGCFPFQSRAFLKIQEGCNNFCTYCIVPYTRGRERSRAFDEIIRDAENSIAAGFHELVLTGVNTCQYSDNGKTLSDVVRTIAALKGDFRIRLSSTEPKMDNIELLKTIADPANRVCRFLHLSMQHASDNILRKMNRHYSFAQYADFVAQARELIPGIHIGTDIIAGFPGETDEDFDICCRRTEELTFANAHIFSFSRREGTPAAVMEQQIHSDIIKKRAKKLQGIAAKNAAKFVQSFNNKELPVIFERKRQDGFYHGWSDNYIEVLANSSAAPGTIEKVQVTLKNDKDAILFAKS